jgi:hypothetical protein
MAGGGHWVAYFLLFLLIEALAPSAIVLFFDSKHRILEGWRPVFLSAFAMLMIFPFYKLGHQSDLRLQGSGGVLVFTAMGVAAGLTSSKFSFRSLEGAMLFALFVIGACYPLGRALLNLKETADYRFETIQRTIDVHDMSEIGKMDDAGETYMSQQYLGQSTTVAYRWLLRK